MNRQEMVVRIAYRRALAQEQVAVVIQDFLSEVKGAVGRGESVQLRGFGTFCPRERKARRGRDMGRSAERRTESAAGSRGGSAGFAGGWSEMRPGRPGWRSR